MESNTPRTGESKMKQIEVECKTTVGYKDEKQREDILDEMSNQLRNTDWDWEIKEKEVEEE